jgi:hypothetical protein
VEQAPQDGTFLVVVARDNADLFDHIRRQLAGDPASEVIADRRHGERRQRLEPGRPDRRCAERRRPLPGQEVPADSPVSIRRRSGHHGAGPGEALPAPPGPALRDEAKSLQGAVTRIEAALRVARSLNALLHQLRQQRLPIEWRPEASGDFSRSEGVWPGSRSRPGPAPGS